MKSVVYLVAALTLTGFIQLENAAAECTCLPHNSATEALRNVTHVFLGDVLSKTRISLDEVKKGYKEEVVKFRIKEYWKGEIGRTFEARTPLAEDDCGTNLETGKTYLVYATGPTPPLFTACTRTYLIDSVQAVRDLEQLGPGTNPDVPKYDLMPQ